jgi:hypothetical protein
VQIGVEAQHDRFTYHFENPSTNLVGRGAC